MRSQRSTSSATTSKPSTSSAPTAASPPASPPAAPAPSSVADVDAVLLDVHLGQPLEPAAQQLDLRRRRALLRREHVGGVDEAGADVAGHDELDAPQPGRRVQGPQRAEPAVGRGRAADADEDPPGAGVEGGG